jgi:hypothetical protein
VVRVSAVEGTRYIVQELEFAANIPATPDELAARWDCSGYSLEIVPLDEARAWFELSTKKFDRGNKAGDRRTRAQAAEPSPERVFRAEAVKAGSSPTP